MRRTVFIIAFFIVRLFAFSDLVFTPDTIFMGDTSVLTGTFSAVGDSADIWIYIDVNQNGAVDVEDGLYWSSVNDNMKFIDGDDDMDPVADGLIELPLVSGEEGPFPMAGSYLFIMADGGGADTAGCVVNDLPTDLYISGTVTGAGDPVLGIILYAEWEDGADYYRRVGSSDENGDFTIYLPEDIQGETIRFGTKDEFGVLEGTSLILPPDSEFIINASLEDVAVELLEATQFLAGTVVDENGDPVVGAPMRIRQENEDLEMYAVSGENGLFVVPVVQGDFRVELETWDYPGHIGSEEQVTIEDGDDTVEVTCLVLAADETISGTIVNNDDAIDLEHDFGIGVNGNFGSYTVRTWAQTDVENSTFTITVSSLIDRYSLDAWGDNIPAGYYVSPTHIDSVAPGTDDIVIEIKSSDQFAVITVLDESEQPVPGVAVHIWQPESNMGQSFVTDQDGIVTAGVYSATWYARLEDESYLQSDLSFAIDEQTDTLYVSFNVMSTDETISGTVSGDLSGLEEPLTVSASYYDQEEDKTYSSWTNVNNDGTYQLNVSSSFDLYWVSLSSWNLPQGYASVPSENNPYSEYPYNEVAPGSENVDFALYAPTGKIFGTFSVTIPETGVLYAGVYVEDSAQGITMSTEFDQDGGYSIDLPNGVYTVIAGYELSDQEDPVYFVAESVVVEDNSVMVNFTPDGPEIMPVIEAAGQQKFVFGLSCYPNPFRGTANICFSSPANGRALLNIYNLAGRTVATLYDGAISAGRYDVRLDRNMYDQRLTSGQLIMRLTINGEQNYTKTIRLVNIK